MKSLESDKEKSGQAYAALFYTQSAFDELIIIIIPVQSSSQATLLLLISGIDKLYPSGILFLPAGYSGLLLLPLIQRPMRVQYSSYHGQQMFENALLF